MFNFYIDNSTFPNGLMMADINPIHLDWGGGGGGGAKRSPPPALPVFPL